MCHTKDALPTIEQINQDRESFLESIRKNVAPELNKIGLYLINVNITDITDESDYIGSIGKKAAAEAINQAKIDMAEQEKHGAIGEAEADKRIYIQEQEAQAQKTRREAKGQADAILLKYQAEAEGVRQVLESKAAGYLNLIKGCNGDAKAAATLLMTEKIEQIVQLQVEAIRNIKIDKITVWDSAGDGKDSTATSNFLAGLIKSLPPLHDVAGMAGIELPKYLGEIASPTGALKTPQEKTDSSEKA